MVRMSSPVLMSITVADVTDEYTLVSLSYRIPKTQQGVELMGIGEGLSWLKGKSIQLKKAKSKSEFAIYRGTIKLVADCEFRGRSYDAEGDHWETVDNHKIARQPNGSIAYLGTPESLENVTFYPTLPIVWVPTYEEAEKRIRHIEDSPSFVQAVIDSIIYTREWMDKPKVLILTLHKIIRYLRTELRKFDSYDADAMINPLLKIYFEMLMEIRTSDETQDPRLLPGLFEKRKYEDTMLEILDNLATHPATNPAVKNDDYNAILDSVKRVKVLFQYL